MSDENRMSEQQAENASLGQGGRKYVGDTTLTTPGTGKQFHALKVITAATFSALVDAGATGTETGIEFPVGYTIYGSITSFTLSGGSVHAYISDLPS